jgi:hypothetical protein
MIDAEAFRGYVRFLASGGKTGAIPADILLVLVAGEFKIPLGLAEEWREKTPELYETACAAMSAHYQAREFVESEARKKYDVREPGFIRSEADLRSEVEQEADRRRAVR